MKLYFKKTGEGHPLVILHGLFGMGDNWSTLSRSYAEHGFSVFVPDLRNHGRSPHDAVFNYEVMAEDLSELIEEQRLEKVSVIGHSMGGKVAMHFAALFSGKMDRLIVVDIATKYYAPHHHSVMAAIHAMNNEVVSSRKEAENIVRGIISQEAIVQFLLKNLYWKEEKKLDWRFNAEAIEKNIEYIGQAFPEKLQVSTPTLFVRGERSGYILKEDEGIIRKQFSDVRFITIPDAGHWVHAENPGGFFNESILFLEEGE